MSNTKLDIEVSTMDLSMYAEDGKRLLRELEDRRSGVSTPGAPSVAPVSSPAIRAWRSAIFNSPEAKGRDDATVELVVKHSPQTLSVDDARAFLRGLPLETSEPPKAPKVTKTNEDPRAARKAELAASMASFNEGRGYAAQRQTPTTGAPTLTGIEPAKLKRLAELRLNALETGQAHRVGDEAKKLRYALQVHDQTGLPLANVFAQLGVDTSKIVR
ncbi:hypothetical protein [Bradyrhizobium sp.]|uniref:hypothetical protein n=1 Tax=Bradyrhizobium sp. TaxID=376 RepID=UPI0025BA93FD|nr:hypothetical protein [Bradyrhizobium sp.]